MAVNIYSKKKHGKIKLSEHFQVEEFACKDGSDEIRINSDLILILEKLYTIAKQKYNSKAININSGYRTPGYSVKVGGYKKDQHTKGNAADIWIKLADGKRLGAKEICFMLEDLKHQGGIGYISSFSVHIDVRGKKCWFDETKKNKTTSSWYSYFENKKTNSVKMLTNVYGRTNGIGFKNKKTLYKKGTIITNIIWNVGTKNGYTWFQGYIEKKKQYFPFNETWYQTI